MKNCSSRYNPPPKLSPGPYWLRGRNLRQDHNDVTQRLKVRRPLCMSHSQRYVVKRLRFHASLLPLECNSEKSFFTLLELKLQFPPCWTRQRLFLFYFRFCLNIHDYCFGSIEEPCTTQSFLTACRKKRLSSEGDITTEVRSSIRSTRSVLAACLCLAFRKPQLTPRSYPKRRGGLL